MSEGTPLGRVFVFDYDDCESPTPNRWLIPIPTIDQNNLALPVNYRPVRRRSLSSWLIRFNASNGDIDAQTTGMYPLVHDVTSESFPNSDIFPANILKYRVA